MNILIIFVYGIIILIGAIILNIIGSFFGVMSWYEFLKEPGKAKIFSYIWLFILYPFGLGLIVYGVRIIFK